MSMCSTTGHTTIQYTPHKSPPTAPQHPRSAVNLLSYTHTHTHTHTHAVYSNRARSLNYINDKNQSNCNTFNLRVQLTIIRNKRHSSHVCVCECVSVSVSFDALYCISCYFAIVRLSPKDRTACCAHVCVSVCV